MKVPLAFALPLLALAGCSSSPTTPDGPLSGAWGGVGASFRASADASLVELDCAHAVGDRLVVENGRFELAATLSVEGGPVPEDPPPGLAATLSGTVRGDRMELSIRVEGFPEPIGSFLLLRGRAPVLRKCL